MDQYGIKSLDSEPIWNNEARKEIQYHQEMLFLLYVFTQTTWEMTKTTSN